MEPVAGVKVFTKLQRALQALDKGTCLGTLVKLDFNEFCRPELGEASWGFSEEVLPQYIPDVEASDYDEYLEESVLDNGSRIDAGKGLKGRLEHELLEQKLRGVVPDSFWCGGSVSIPSHDAKSVVLKLLAGPQKMQSLKRSTTFVSEIEGASCSTLRKHSVS